MSILRNALRTACLAAALAPATLAAQGLRVTPYGGITPAIAVAAGGQVEVGVTENLAVFGDYSRWAWGLICFAPAGEGEEVGEGNRCGETGWTAHGGATLYLRDVATWRRPYVSFSAGAAQVLDAGEAVSRLNPSIASEVGLDFGGDRALLFRLGLRWQGRPGIGTDYVGPVAGFQLRLR